jgi:hypothetical protein
MNNVKGKIIVLKETEEVSDKFSKREMVVQTEEKYPQTIPIEFTQDRCSLLDVFKNGEDVDVSVNLVGRVWNNPKTQEDRYFLSLSGWRIEKLNQTVVKNPEGNIERAFQEEAINQMDEDDDLPF